MRSSLGRQRSARAHHAREERLHLRRYLSRVGVRCSFRPSAAGVGDDRRADDRSGLGLHAARRALRPMGIGDDAGHRAPLGELARATPPYSPGLSKAWMALRSVAAAELIDPPGLRCPRFGRLPGSQPEPT
jgi:hypothetical protein